MSFVSKSTFIQGLQCPKLLWFRYNAKDQFPATDQQQQAAFDQGKEVGSVAKQLFPDGVEITGEPYNYDRILDSTQKSLDSRRPLFEAGFGYHGGYARVDILEPVGRDEWNIIEVKGTTEVKDVHLPDIAFQAYVLSGAGQRIRRCFLLHLNSDYVRKGPIDPRQLFTKTDVTAKVSGLSRDVEAQIEEMQKTIGLPAHPAVKIGPHCDDPYTCPLHALCWGFMPEHNVFSLYRGTKKAFKLLDRGIQTLAAIPDDYPLTANQTIQRQAVLTGKPHLDQTAIATFLRGLKYPVAYMDFETIGPAIPLFDDSSPFEQIPFQYSLHIVRSKAAPPEHRMFLAEGRDDPRLEFLQRLRQDLPGKGSIVVFNESFERGRLEECCALHPEFLPWLAALKPRLVDLLLPFRGFRYYHPDQDGSASMKAVLPALTGKGYDHLDIREGGTASLEFLRVTFGDVTDKERRKVRRQLEDYCGQDTEGMIWIVDALRRLVG